MSREGNSKRVELEVLVSDGSVRLYGNKAFFRHLQSQIDLLLSCPPHGHCEYQTVSLEAELPAGLTERPDYRVLRIDRDEEDISRAQKVPDGEFDVIFMVVEDRE